MRILILSSEFPPGPGGIGTHAFQLANYFASQENPVFVLAQQDYVTESEREKFNRRQKLEIVTLPSGSVVLKKWRERSSALNSALISFQPDIVLVSGGRSIWLSAGILRRKKIPWVAVGHGTEFGAESWVNALITRVSCNLADAIIAVSEYTLNSMLSLGISKPTTKVINNGADARIFQPIELSTINAFRRENDAVDKFVLLTVGNVTARKGQEWVIRALPAIISRYPNVVYWIAGLPTEQKRLEMLAENLGVSKNVRFWGRVDPPTLLGLYNACDLFLMTSQQLRNGDFEGYGIAVIEAALCGKTSVVTDNSGLAEAVQDRVTGILVPQGSVEPIEDSVINLIESPDLLKKLSETARDRALKYQTWDHVGSSYLQFFEEILSKG